MRTCVAAARSRTSFVLSILLVCAAAIPRAAAGGPGSPAAQEHEYHLWDVLTSHAADYLAPAEESASAMLHKARRSASRAVSYVLGSQPEAQPHTGMERLGDMLGALGRGVSPSWPEAVFESTRDPAFTKFIHELSHASQRAHTQVRSKLDAHSAILQRVVRAHQSVLLPLACRYVPLLALLVACAAIVIWSHMQPPGSRASPKKGHGAARAALQAADVSSVTASCVNLALIPMAVMQLAALESSGSAEWVVVAGYCTLLAAATAIAVQHSKLTRATGSDAIARLARVATAGTMAAAGAYGLLQPAFV